MDILSPSSAIAVCSLSALVLGGALGAWVANRIARRDHRGLERTLARRELALLDARHDGTVPVPEADMPRARGEDALLDIAVQQLDEARDRADALHAALEAQERHHALDIAKLRLAGVRARKRTHRALTALAAYRADADPVRARRGTAAESVPRVHQERRIARHERRIARDERRVAVTLHPLRHDTPVPDTAQTPPTLAEAANHARARPD